MARLGPTHGTNTGSRAPIVRYDYVYFRVYINVVQRAESIGGFIMDDIMITMCDMGQNLQTFLAGSSLNFNKFFKIN